MSIQPLIFKNGVYTLPRSAADIEALKVTLGVSTSNFVDVSSNQTIDGVKLFSGSLRLPNNSGSVAGTIWRSGDNLEYKDGANVTKILLNSAGNLSNLMNKQTALNNLVNGQTANRVLRSNGTNVTLSQVALDTDVINVLPINNGGTGSSTQNFVDLSTNQDISGNKYFLKPLFIGTNSTLDIQSYTQTDLKIINTTSGNNVINSFAGSIVFSSNPSSTFSFLNNDFSIGATSTTPITTTVTGGFYRFRNNGTGLLSAVQGLRLVALNSGTGNIITLDGAAFVARNDSVGTTVTTVNGGNFSAQLTVGSTATTLNAGTFLVSAVASSTSTTLRGILVTASSNNTTPATDCIGIDIASITGTATNKFALRTGIGRVLIGDTTSTTSTTTGSLVTGGGFACLGNIYGGAGLNLANLPTSSTGLPAGSLWRNGNIVNIV